MHMQIKGHTLDREIQALSKSYFMECAAEIQEQKRAKLEVQLPAELPRMNNQSKATPNTCAESKSPGNSKSVCRQKERGAKTLRKKSTDIPKHVHRCCNPKCVADYAERAKQREYHRRRGITDEKLSKLEDIFNEIDTNKVCIQYQYFYRNLAESRLSLSHTALCGCGGGRRGAAI